MLRLSLDRLDSLVNSLNGSIVHLLSDRVFEIQSNQLDPFRVCVTHSIKEDCYLIYLIDIIGMVLIGSPFRVIDLLPKPIYDSNHQSIYGIYYFDEGGTVRVNFPLSVFTDRLSRECSYEAWVLHFISMKEEFLSINDKQLKWDINTRDRKRLTHRKRCLMRDITELLHSYPRT